MRRSFSFAVIALTLCLALPGLHASEKTPTASPLSLPISGNPLLQVWDAPFGAPPFDQIDAMHFEPALEEAMRRQQADLQRIRELTDKPTFANTIEALERAGADLRRIAPVFMNLYSANSTAELQKLGGTLLPRLMSNQAALFVDSRLFSRVKPIYLQRDMLGLNDEQKRVVERYYTQFVLGGAALEGEDRQRFKSNLDQLAQLAVQFNQNLLSETNQYFLLIADAEELAGLPEDVVAAAAATPRRAARTVNGLLPCKHRVVFRSSRMRAIARYEKPCSRPTSPVATTATMPITTPSSARPSVCVPRTPSCWVMPPLPTSR